MQFKRITISTLAILSVASILIAPVSAKHNDGKTYRVTITNLTPGQPFTPPVLIAHTAKTGIFTVGEAASAEIQALAENGNAGPLMAALSVDVEVHDVVAGMAPLVSANNPGGTMFASTASYMIETRGKADRLSFVSMLICTNDGFTALDSIKLPKKTMTVYSVAYDARTETNTEAFADMVPPCQALIGGIMPPVGGTGMSDPLLAEDGVVIPHVGIIGGIDLHPGVHGWSDPVTKIVIERMKGASE
jgi:hypothetical protein